MSKKFEKIFSLDTNIILDNAFNVITLSESSKNLIVLPETVLDEIDSKKSGMDEINFQARQFARLLFDAKIKNKIDITISGEDDNITNLTIVETTVDDVTIYIISKDHYGADSENMSKSILNDRKILEVTKDLQSLEEYKDIIFISQDVMARTRAISLGVDTEALNFGRQEADFDKEFHSEIHIMDYEGDTQYIPEQDPSISSVEVTNDRGKHFIYFRSKSGWTQISEGNPMRLPVPPINKRQKIMSEIIMDGSDVTVIAGPAGTGKTLIALSCAMRTIDTDRDKYKKIYYIRRTVISGSKEDELGFLPGTLEEKMQGYNAPMEDSLKKVAQLKKRGATKEVIEDAILDLKEKYDVEYLYAGHLRGSTLEDGSILIADEIQNWDITSIRTIFSRMGKNSHIIAMGSNNQIDSQYLTKNTNALTFLMDKCGQDNESNVKIQGIKLTNVMRSKLAEWADIELY